ncbi:MAG: recombinase XerD [Actinomycetota bacterium]|nr:recombinase XerD [Actinomycetota bacterium]
MRTTGTCPGCHTQRLLPGPPSQPGGPRCADCAGITDDFHCQQCGAEGEIFRRGSCARCALRNELTEQLLTTHGSPGNCDAATRLIDSLCAAGRPESIFTWKRSPTVQGLLGGIGNGAITLTHEGLDALGVSRAVEHLRAILVIAQALPARDPYLAYFQRWIEAKLTPLPTQIGHPVKEFATWHHLRRIRGLAGKGSLRGPVHSAKQEITETIKFLTWLDQTHGRTAATCTQQDVDAYLADGPTTRTLIRTFFVIAHKTHLNRAVRIKARQAGQGPILTQEQRLQWIRELLTGTSESLPYRVAGVLLLLLAQPLVKIAALRTEDVAPTPGGLTIRLGRDPLALPEPFADLVRQHVKNRPNMATVNSNSPWLFPSNRAGQHLHPNTIMLRLRQLGVDLRGARNRALADLVTTIPPSLVADALGYSYQTVFNHAANAGDNWARYVGQG